MKSKQCTPAGEWEAFYMNMKRGGNTAVIIHPHAQERRVCETQLKAVLARGKTPFPHWDLCVCVCGCYLLLLTEPTNSVIPRDYSPACCCCLRQTTLTPARRCAAATAALILRDAFIIYSESWNWCLRVRVCNSIKLLQLKIIDLYHWLCSTGTKHCFFCLPVRAVTQFKFCKSHFVAMWPARRQTERTTSKSTSCILQHEEHFLSWCPLPGLFWEQACMYFKHLEQVTSPRVACALVPIPTVKLSSVTLADRQQPLKKS